MKLPAIPYAEAGGLNWQESFGGLNMNLSASEGEIAVMGNLTADHAPVLSARPKRYCVGEISPGGSLGGDEELYWAADGGFYYGGVLRGPLSEGPKSFYRLNHWIILWPDKLFYNTVTEEFGSLEASVKAAGAEFLSQAAPGGISDRANCLYMEGVDMEALFRAGEAVSIRGCEQLPGNNQTLVIREVQGSCLYFYDGSFPLPETLEYRVMGTLEPGRYHFLWPEHRTYYFFELEQALTAGDRLEVDRSNIYMKVLPANGEAFTLVTGTGAFGDRELEMERICLSQRETAEVTVAREVPDMEFLCQWGNRLWGVGGNSIYGCRLGDAKTWYNFDGTAADCWSVEVGSAGAFTGAFSYGGYPLFFKEDHIYRLYGTKPSNYQLFDSEALGCEAGSHKSFAVVGQTLYYKSRAGFVAYNGGVPRKMDAPLGTARRQDAVAGSDGRKYYVSCREGEQWSLLVYDSLTGLWHREDDSRAGDFVWCGGELYMLRQGQIWMLGSVRSPRGQQEETVESFCEFADAPGPAGGRIAVRRLRFRVQCDGELTAWICYDSTGRWEKAASVAGKEPGVKTMELVPRRCDHYRIRLEGRGDWKLWALGREYEMGSRS